MKNPVRVTITGAAGNIGYALAFRVAAGDMLGPDQPVILQLLEITPALDALKGVAMELNDCAFPLLRGLGRPGCGRSKLNCGCLGCVLAAATTTTRPGGTRGRTLLHPAALRTPAASGQARHTHLPSQLQQLLLRNQVA